MANSASRSIPAGLTTALIADSCLRLNLPLRKAPPSIKPLVPGAPIFGSALPARHAGSVDVFLAALEQSQPGQILVIDDGGRTDRACIGDLIALEVQAAGLEGIIVWGSHRDSAELRAIGLPVYSLGANSAGPIGVEPRHPDALSTAEIDKAEVTSDDFVFADEDGVIFIAMCHLAEILRVAAEIATKERAQAQAVQAGTNMRSQLKFAQYLEQQRKDPAFTFRAHLRAIGGAVEE